MLQVWPHVEGSGRMKVGVYPQIKAGFETGIEENPQKTQDIEKESTKYSWKYFVKKSTFNKK